MAAALTLGGKERGLQQGNPAFQLTRTAAELEHCEQHLCHSRLDRLGDRRP